jgi:hypothetical protein
MRICNMVMLITSFLILPLFAHTQAAGEDGFGSDPLNIPPLAALIDSAIVRSPILIKYDAAIEKEKFFVDFERRRWMDFIYFEGNTRYGVYDQIYVQGEADGLDPQLAFLNSRKQTWYYAGVSLKMPLSVLVNSGKHVQQMKISVDAINYEREMLKDELQKQIIESYYTVLFRYESMNTFYTIYQDLKIAYLDAVNRLAEQKINFHDYAILSSTYGKAKNDYDQAKNDFVISLNLLRFMTGWDF